MASFNRVVLLGNITRDIEVKYLQSGMAVTELGLAVNDKRKNQQGEWIEETTFVDITLWGRTAEVAGEYLGKGSQVLIEGRLKLDTWEKDGQKRSKLHVVGERMQMLGSKGGGKGGGGGGGGANQQFDDGGEYGEASEPQARGGSRGAGSAAGGSGGSGSGGGMRGPSAGSSRGAAPSAPPPPTQDDIPF